MVCRENKARSAVMGTLKRMMAKAGYSDYKDHEFQSAIHEYGHAFAGADDPTREEYEDFLRGMRQQVINDESIPDQEKYRVSHKQPGVVTRLDQEIKRVQTGRDETGRPLRPEQINGGKHFQAMKHMSAILTRQQEAKQAYYETYARSTGVSVSQARQRYVALTSLPVEEREDTKINLRDGWRDNLNSSGISRKMQADLGQSNEARFALSVMESERQSHIAALPSRATFEAPNVSRTTYISPEQAQGMVKCDQCGQFGHEENACPNQAQFDDLLAAENRLADARAEVEDAEKGALAKVSLMVVDDEGNPPESQYVPAGPSGPAGYTLVDGTRVDTPEEWRERTQAMADAYDPAALKAAQKKYMAADVARDEARAAFTEARGPVPQVSSALVEAKYNPDNGALMVTRPGYTRKTDGVTMPPKDYVYLMGREEYEAFQASDSPGKFLSDGPSRGRARGGNAGWTPANEAEAKAVLRQVQCPTCGRWASMTSEHQCPVPGGRQGEVDAATIERARAARERAKLDSLPVNIADTTKRELVQAQTVGEIRGGRISFPNSRAMSAAADRGAVGMGGFTANYYGATVNGRAYAWTDPQTGERVFTARNVKCSQCPPGGCVHIDKAADMMANHYRATRVSGANPGNRVFRRETEASLDSKDWRSVEESYAQIRARRAENAERVIANSQMDPNLRQAALYPRDAQGTPVRWPRTYTDPQGRSIPVDDDGAATSQAVLAGLQERTGRRWVAKPDGRGGFTITSPPWRRRDGEISLADKKALADTFGGTRRGRGTGYHVPGDSSWRHEALSRVHGQSPTVLGARRMMRMGDAPGPDA